MTSRVGNGTKHVDIDYQRARADHDKLSTFLPRFAAAKAFFRRAEPVSATIRREIRSNTIPGANRDRAVCVLANKAVNTHAAVRLMTDAGHGDDAMALSRVLLENAALLEWLLLDPVYRLDLYCLSDALFRRRWLELIRDHYGHRPEAIATAEQQVDADVFAVAEFFGNTQSRWAQVLSQSGRSERLGIDDMFHEMAHGPSGRKQPSFLYEVVYFRLSAFVHSTAQAMRSFGRARQEHVFTLEMGANERHCPEALRSSNLCLFYVLQNVSEYLGLREIEEELEIFFRTMKTARVDDDPMMEPAVDH